ncbi:hypothetical protein TWF192_005722 [Orbilia oligospora]|uniref:Uncharacterized protein n=1 Tax=Orbilia oligospora TaxID=2813651 RepID=A0A6G1MLX9_ORBOL|nr:hypothetical protein TWF191_003917 [Orbilia oligospora]KAF3263441.1 hypothetical protein TWF192_005722 [Orbilia oligospora]
MQGPSNLFIPPQKLLDKEEPLPVRMLGEWYNLHIAYCAAVKEIDDRYSEDPDSDHIPWFCYHVSKLSRRSAEQLLKLGGSPYKLPQGLYLQELESLKTRVTRRSGNLDETKTVHEAISAYLRSHVGYPRESKFPCVPSGDCRPQSNIDSTEYEKQILQFAVWAELILVAIECVKQCQVTGFEFQFWFKDYSFATTACFAQQAHKEPILWVPSNRTERGPEFSNALTTYASNSSTEEKTALERQTEFYQNFGFSQSLETGMLDGFPESMVLKRTYNRRKLPLKLPTIKPNFGCRGPGLSSTSYGISSQWEDLENLLHHSETGKDFAVQLTEEQTTAYKQKSRPASGFNNIVLHSDKVPALIQAIIKSSNGYLECKIWNVAVLAKSTNLATLTFLHLSGSGLFSSADTNIKTRGIVSSLNWLFGMFVSLRKFCWDSLSPCHDYEFQSLIQPPRNLRSFELLQENCSPDLRGYSRIHGGQTNPRGSDNHEAICSRFSEVVTRSALEYFHVRVMYGPRYQCSRTQRRERAGFIGFKNLHSVERINWASEWKWEKDMNDSMSGSLVSCTVQHCEWERDEVRSSGEAEEAYEWLTSAYDQICRVSRAPLCSPISHRRVIL